MIVDGKRILRVFPRRTSYTPDDPYAIVGTPWGDDWPEADEVHISCTFSWDKDRAEALREIYASRYLFDVMVGGPAYGHESGEFTPGLYVREGVTFTTRGCPNSCPWCIVRAPFEEIEIKPGHIVQDNNILAASRLHFRRVCEMLNAQKRGANFRGGLEAARLTDWHVDELRGLRSIRELWLACDNGGAFPTLERAVEKLSWLPRRKLRCYVLCGYNGDDLESARARLEAVWQLGCVPFCQLYQPAGEDAQIDYSGAWRKLRRQWCRVRAIFASHQEDR